jgi:uncharacterized repeat protein (TIGR01451 family)
MKKIAIAAAVMLLGSSGAWALTLAGTNISNSASLTYSAGGVDQTDAAHGGPKTSNTDEFIVDKKIDFTLTNNDGDQVSTNVVAGAQDINTTWALTNIGNMDQNFTLASVNLTSSESIYGDADTADTGTQTIWYSTDGGTTWIDFSTTSGYIQINGDHSGNSAASRTVHIRVASDIPNTVSNGDIMNIQLTATAVQSDGSTTETETSAAGNTNGADRQAVMDTVLAEETTLPTPTQGNASRDAVIKKWGGYIVTTAVLDVTKLSCVISDGINTVAANYKRIPGATIAYVFDINNTGTAAATDVILSDDLPGELDETHIHDIQLQANVGNTACTCDAGTGNNTTGTASTPTNSQASHDVEIAIGTINARTGAAGTSNHSCLEIQVEIK